MEKIGTRVTRVRIYPVSGHARFGGTYTIEIRVEGVANLYGWQCSLGFNSAILQPIVIEEGGFLRGTGSQTYWRSPEIGTGSLKNIACTKTGTSTGISGSGILASIKFKVIGTSTNMPSYLAGVIATLKVKANKEGVATISVRDVLGVSPDIERILINSTDISFHIIPLKSNLSTLTCTVYPNPSLNNQPITFDTSAVIEIYTLSGELVKTIMDNK